eukprot:7161457-Pyramimonas_sp.AAC.1
MKNVQKNLQAYGDDRTHTQPSCVWQRSRRQSGVSRRRVATPHIPPVPPQKGRTCKDSSYEKGGYVGYSIEVLYCSDIAFSIYPQQPRRGEGTVWPRDPQVPAAQRGACTAAHPPARAGSSSSFFIYLFYTSVQKFPFGEDT